MKVILVNGSPRKSGCTACALDEVRKTLEKEGIETEIFWIGTSVQNCIGCDADSVRLRGSVSLMTM